MAVVASQSENIEGSMKEEKMIRINACVASGAVRFSINLVCLNGDNAFHFNPRFDQGVVVCNTYTNGRWGKEERTTHIPFRRGESFEMTITVKSACYEVSVNGVRFLAFDHRLPYHTVKKLEFKDDVRREDVSYPTAPGKSPQDPPPYSTTAQGDTRTEIGDLEKNKQ